MTTSGTSTYDPENYRLRTFYDASAQFRDGRDTPRAYLERCLETIEEKEPLVRVGGLEYRKCTHRLLA